MTTVEFRTAPETYRHWKLEHRRPGRDAGDGRRRGRRPGPRLRAEAQLATTSASTSSCYDAVQRLRFEHPEVRTVVVTSAQGQDLLRRREHPDARRVAAPVEGELLQVHQRDPQRRSRTRPSHSGQTYLAAVNGTRLRRRLRAGAGLRAHHAGRRPLVRGLAARAAAARRAARHRRADPGGRQAARAQRPGRLVRDPVRGRAAARRPSQWRLVDEVVPRGQWDETVRRARGRAAPPAPTARPTRPGSRCPRWASSAPTTRIGYRHVDRGARPGARRWSRSPSAGRRATSPTPARPRARRGVLAAGDDPRARRPDPATCAPTSSELGTWVLRTARRPGGVARRTTSCC